MALPVLLYGLAGREEKEIQAQVERYLLNQKRYETNAKIVEALLA